jgi:hypothetical protein
MTVLYEYQNRYVPIKYFLNSYRALSDGKSGVQYLEQHIKTAPMLLSEWKIFWIGACAVLRASIDLFQRDAKSCINRQIREQILFEWHSIKDNRSEHAIFWEFLRKERDNIVHQYQWNAYEVWMAQDGTIRPSSLSLLVIRPEDVRPVLIMREGHYKNRNSLELLKESADWVQARIFGAINRAGFDPEEDRRIGDFQKRPPAGRTLLGNEPK